MALDELECRHGGAVVAGGREMRALCSGGLERLDSTSAAPA